MKLIYTVIFSFFWFFGFSQFNEVQNKNIQSQGIDGFPVANFAISANISDQGGMFEKILRNPGKLGRYLEDLGKLEFFIKTKGELIPFDKLLVKQTREFPIVKGEYQLPKYEKIGFLTSVWSPIAANDIKFSSLPVIQMELDLINNNSNDQVLNIVCKSPTMFKATKASSIGPKLNSLSFGDINLAANNSMVWNADKNQIEIPIMLVKGQRKKILVAFSIFDNKVVCANYFSSQSSLIDFVFAQWDSLKASTLLFKKKIPLSGDKELDEYMHWNILPAVVLTKCTQNGEVLTMGYRELNQRDSYWTSWMHLILFPSLDKKMIEESVTYQKQSGKVPTTILPLIDRNDDLDINAYFVLRAIRHVNFYNDIEFGKKLLPNIEKALDWLIARDVDGFGIPKQGSFWGDWKDVKGVKNRIYSPYTAFLYLAALKQTIEFVERAGIKLDIERFRTAFDKGYAFVNQSVDKGGMWTGTYYTQLWNDGRKCDKVLEDQMVGVFFGIIDKTRAGQIIKTLEKNNATPFGIAETFPYYKDGFFDPPGDYHNGGVWPHLNFMDAWARCNLGMKKSAVRLVKHVCRADLSKDFTPNEYLNSMTGENRGQTLQGWNANYFGFVYFGILKNKLNRLNSELPPFPY